MAKVIYKVKIVYKGVEQKISIGGWTDRDNKDKKAKNIRIRQNEQFVYVDVDYEDNTSTTFAFNIAHVSGFEAYYKNNPS